MTQPNARRTIFLALAAAAAVLAVLACSIGGGSTAGSGDFRLENESGQTICYVFISPTTSTVWGDDWLGDTEVIEDGDARLFDVPAGDYDLLATDCNQNTVAEVRLVTVPNSGYTWTIR
jgi:hypothetical protein